MCGNALLAQPSAGKDGPERQVPRRGGAAMQQEAGLVAGMRQVQRLIAAGRASRVLVAEDADERMLKTLRTLCAEADIPVETCESMEKLGRRCRIAVPCAAAAEKKGE